MSDAGILLALGWFVGALVGFLFSCTITVLVFTHDLYQRYNSEATRRRAVYEYVRYLLPQLFNTKKHARLTLRYTLLMATVGGGAVGYTLILQWVIA